MTPMPTGSQLSAYYAGYSQSERVSSGLGLGSRFPMLRKLYHRLSGDIDPRDFVEVPEGARVLDYGCGHAAYLSSFHDRGVAISGAEIAECVVDECRRRGFDVRVVKDSSHLPYADGEYDIVYLMQVFEHLNDPHGFMDELARITADSGVLYLAVPNAASIWRKVFQKNWVSGWYAPFHLLHYNRDNMARLAGQHGFDVIEIWSNTPLLWFRLNLKASWYPGVNRLDCLRSWLDSRLIGCLLMLALRIVEVPFHERDCLVMKFKRRDRVPDHDDRHGT